MRFGYIYSLLVLLLCFETSSANFFVQLKKPYTIDDLLKSDDKITNVKEHVRALVEHRVSFGSFEGFSGHLHRDVVRRLLRNSMVLNIVRDVPIKVFDDDINDAPPEKTTHEHYNADDNADDDNNYTGHTGDESTSHETLESWEYETQFMAPRHLARLSRRGALPFSESVNYYYDPKALGKDVYAYIIDTGINKDHPEFESRVVLSKDFTFFQGRGDQSGHGSHVAGLVGSKTFGVAKSVSLVDLKALGSHGEGTLSTVLSALEFAVHHRQSNSLKAVANLSLGSFKNSVLNDAINAAVDSGLVVVVAAGNFGSDSCKSSPASAEKVISVGAIDDRTDDIAIFSNWGQCVHVFGSGIQVHSVSHASTQESAELSGTSMASPVIAGLAAVLLSSGVETKDVKTRIIEMSTFGVINGIRQPTTPNHVAFNGISKEDDFYAPETMYNESLHGPMTQPNNAKALHSSMGVQDDTQLDIDEWSDYLSNVQSGSMEALFGPGWESECKDVEPEMELIYNRHFLIKETEQVDNQELQVDEDYISKHGDIFESDDEVVDESDMVV